MISSYHELQTMVAGMLDVPSEELEGYEDSLLDFGLDSVQLMSLVSKLEELGINVSFIEMAANVTLPHWWKLLNQKLAEQG